MCLTSLGPLDIITINIEAPPRIPLSQARPSLLCELLSARL
jgi:hypothetical protein